MRTSEGKIVEKRPEMRLFVKKVPSILGHFKKSPYFCTRKRKEALLRESAGISSFKDIPLHLAR